MRFRTIIALSSVILTFTHIRAKNVELSGYYEPQYLGSTFYDGYIQLFTNKLRVDLQAARSDNLVFAANFDFITYHGYTGWNAVDFMPLSIRESVPPSFREFYSFSYADTLFLDNAYVKLIFDRLDLTIGRQQISLGTGYVWNPTDLFNYKSLIDPTYEQPGHNAIRADIPLLGLYSMSIIFTPENTWSRSTKLARIKGNAGHFDFSVIFTEKNEKTTDYRDFSVDTHRRRLFGGDLVGELLGLGVWAEAAFNDVPYRDNFWEIDGGLDYTLDDGTYILAEYYHNGPAKSSFRDYDLNDWMQFIVAESRTISRENLYLYADHPLTDLIHLNGSIPIDLTGPSVAIIPGLYYSLRENLDLNIFVNFNTGKPGKAYSSDLEQNGIIRLKYYF